jgi:phenylalanyl-tRNA synthetase beta subunit
MVLKGVPAKFNLIGIAVAQPNWEPVEQEIVELSPSFVEIYQQAQTAEQVNLDQIAGLAYRKALEFLVKDYLISKSPDDAAAIKGALLGKCIDRFDDERIRTAVERAIWLGNDEAHYVRRWQGMDVTDLKRLIKLVLAHLHLESQHEQLKQQMPGRRAS